MTPRESSEHGERTAARDGLDEMVAAFDRSHEYTTQRLLKENELERTELVCDGGGRRFIRKYIALGTDGEHPYERLRGVEHPRLQRVCETQRAGGRLIVVCAYVEGVNLRDYVAARGRLDEGEAVALLCDVCEALGVLHAMPGAAIVHRDVNPGNIVVSGGRACLVDLGIARSKNETAARDTHAWGTKGYTAPEQFGFRQTDARADVYSAGRVLGFMLAGEGELQEAGDDELQEAGAGEGASGGEWGVASGRCGGPAGGMSSDVRRVYEKATRLDPADRFQSAQELADALRDALVALAAQPEAGSGPQGLQAPEAGGAPRRSRVVRACWRVWQVVATAAAALIVVGTLNAIRLDPTPVKIPGYLIMGILCFAMPLAMSANLANVNDRIAWLRENRRKRIVAIWAMAWGLFVVYAFIAAALGYDPNAGRA